MAYSLQSYFHPACQSRLKIKKEKIPWLQLFKVRNQGVHSARLSRALTNHVVYLWSKKSYPLHQGVWWKRKSKPHRSWCNLNAIQTKIWVNLLLQTPKTTNSNALRSARSKKWSGRSASGGDCIMAYCVQMAHLCATVWKMQLERVKCPRSHWMTICIRFVWRRSTSLTLRTDRMKNSAHFAHL